MMKYAAPIAGLLALAGCDPTQQQAAQGYQDKITGACNVAMTLAPLAGAVAPWIVGGCSTEAAIAKLALDPTSLAWVNGLVGKVKAL